MIKVIDAICGAGKTSYAIQLMNETSFRKKGIIINPKKYIYVTPFLSEVERIVNNTEAKFSEPTGLKGSKYEHVKKLVEAEENIVMTHELFSRLDEDILSDIQLSGYNLIMDEVANVLDQISISHQDLEYLLQLKVIEVSENGKVTWLDEEYNIYDADARFRDIKVLADKDNLYLERNVAMFWIMDVKSFTCFKDVYILTYMFDGQLQKYYYDLFNLEYQKCSVVSKDGRYELVEYNKNIEPRAKIKDLLNVYEDKITKGRASTLNSNYIEKTNKQDKFILSKSWFRKSQTKEIEQLNKNLYNYFKNINSVPVSDLYWTTSKNYAVKLKNAKTKLNVKDDRTKDNFLPMNARATNNYAHCTAMAYVYNRFMNPLEKSFFENRGVKVNQDLLAVSDLVQFLFRGCIRNDEPMDCYIPAPRMRQLLYDWMEFKI